MKSAGKARNNGLYRHIRTSKEIIRNLLNDYLQLFRSSSVYNSFYQCLCVIAASMMLPYAQLLWLTSGNGQAMLCSSVAVS